MTDTAPWEDYQRESAPWEDYAKEKPKAKAPRGGAPMAESQYVDRPPKRSFVDNVLRGAGLDARSAMQGVADISGLVVNPIAYATDKIGLTNTGGIGTQGAMNYYADKFGLPTPENRAERIGSDIVRAGSGGLTMGGAGNLIKQGTGYIGEFGRNVISNPLAQATATVSGASAANVAREDFGADAYDQMAAGFVGGMAPSSMLSSTAGLARLFLRGGEQGRKTLAQNIETFKNAGDYPTVGQGSETRVSRGIESLLSKSPGSSGVMANRAEQQAANIGSKVEQTAQSIAQGANPTTAGRAIVKGITGANGFIPKFKATASRLYDVVDNYFPPDSPVAVTNTKAYLDSATTPIQGAPSLSARLANKELDGLKAALDDDLMAQVNQAQNGTLPYAALKQLRTRIGDKIADAGISPDVPTAQLKKIYGALSSDIEASVVASGNPNAIQAYRRANAHYKAGQERIDSIKNVVEKNGGTEKVFNAAMSGTRDGATTINALMKSLPQEGREMIASAVIKRLGKANPSNQNDLGEVFSTERFLTNWNTMDKSARGALFNRLDPQYVRNLDAIAKVASNIRDGSKVFANPSGTAPAGANLLASGAFLYSLVTGGVGTAATIAGGALSANAASRYMSSPSVVNFLAKTTTLPPSTLSAQIPLLSKQAEVNGDKDLQEVIELYKQSQNRK